MTDLAELETKSTELDTNLGTGAAGGGSPRTLADPEAKPKPESLRDTVAAAVKEDADGKGKEPEEKGDKEPEDKPGKDAKTPDEKPDEAEKGKKPTEEAKPDKDGGKPDEKPADDDKAKGHIEPPKTLLPDAKDVWRNTPRPVQRDVENLVRQHETEVTELREAGQRYESLREFDELAKSNGRDLRESLAKMSDVENTLRDNPIAGLNKILMEIGPRKADGQPVSLFEVAQFVMQQGPQGYQQIVSQQPQQQAPQNDNPEVSQLRQQVAQMQEMQLTATVIEPFKADHPRYDELQEDIAFFLQSGKVPSSLSPSDRLAAAYDMAVRINPASHDDQPATPTNPDLDRRADDFSGSKSIKSAPGAVSPDMEPDRGGSIQDLLRDEMRRAKRS